jgi:cytochrome c553
MRVRPSILPPLPKLAKLKVWVTTLLQVLLVLTATACSSPDPVIPFSPALDLTTATKRGAELVNGLAACGFCHAPLDSAKTEGAQLTNDTPPLSGGRKIGTIYGEISAPNITPSLESGIGALSNYDIRSILRTSARSDGSEVNSSVHKGFEWLSDTDIFAITSYLRSLPAVENKVERYSPSVISRNTTGIFDTRIEVKGYVPAISTQFKQEYGGYLVDHVARCASCHNSPAGIFSSERYLAGGKEISIDGEVRLAPPLLGSPKEDPEGEEQPASLILGPDGIRRYLKSGTTPDGRMANARFCPTTFYSKATELEIDAIVSYLSSDLRSVD